MSYFKRPCRGFTLIEILVSAIILVIAVAAFFTVFISVATLRVHSVNDFRLSVNALSWLEKVRTGSTDTTKYNDPAFIAQTDIDLNDAASILQEDYNNWIAANESNIDIQNPGDDSKGAFYTIEDNINLGSGVYFKKITITVLWDEED